ncbi:hypothetical protein [Bradyrhizobium sp. McL0615]|uniref:hypothetical protein n=1 Tax=Bradyrhizobium sp. McL0615 TaxID=3415673 RepID=UPI003CE6C40A
MARFRCRACGQEGDFVYQAERHECPRCASIEVQFALGVEELPDGFVEMLLRAERLDDHETDKD